MHNNVEDVLTISMSECERGWMKNAALHSKSSNRMGGGWLLLLRQLTRLASNCCVCICVCSICIGS